MLLKDKISNKTKNCFKKWEALKSIMEISDLLTMFKGLRTKPIPTEANPRGYTDGYHVLHKGRTYTIGPDDVNKYIWDFRRLYPLIDAAFDSSAWHLSQVGFRNHDAIMVYNDLEKHFEGRDAKDVLYHTMNLHRFTAQPKEFDIKEDIVRLDDLFREVDEVTGTPLSDIYKLSYFMCHFQSDTRPGVATRIATLDFTGCNYNDMFRAIYDLSVVAPVHLQHLKALTKTPKTKKEKSNEICRNFQKGLCKYPDCRYKHVLETAPGTKTQAALPVTPPKKSLPSKTAYPAYITSEHRRQIGPPAGVVSSTNPTGISRKQMYALKIFDRAGALDSSSPDNDPWLSGSIGHAAGSSRVDYPRLLMLRQMSSSSSTAASAADPSESESEEDDMSSTGPFDFKGDPFSPSLDYLGPTDEHPHMYDTDMIVTSYNKHLQSTSDDIRHWVLYVNRHVDMKDRTPTPTLAIFGWANRGPTSSISLARPDIATGSQHLMHALYMLNAQYLNAQASAPSYFGYWEPDQFMTFNPSHPNYKAPGTSGSYVSTVKDISQYYNFLLTINSLDRPAEETLLMYAGLFLDFCAYCAQSLRYLLDGRPATPALVRPLRQLILDSIHTMDATQDVDSFSTLCNVLRAIAREVEPNPPDGSSPPPHPTAPLSHKKRRRTADDDITPIKTKDITRIKFRRFESGKRINQRTSFVPPTPPQPRSSTDSVVFRLMSPPVSTSRPRSVLATPPTVLPTAVTDASDEPPVHHANLIVLRSETMLRLSSERVTIFDSGCSISGTSNVNALSNITDCPPMQVQGAFGPSTQPSKRGTLGPLGLEAILLPGLGNQTLVSISQFCAGGTTGAQNVGVFTSDGFRMFRLDTVLPALKLMAEHGHEIVRGTVQEGIYVQEST